MPSKLNIEAIDLFCGVGGLTNGFEQSGIKVIAGIDNDPTCKYAFEKNNKAKFIQADIKEFDNKEINKLFSKNSIRVLAGCAPCQPFSSHTNKNKNKDDDKRWDLLSYFGKMVEETLPEIVSVENVRGLKKTDVFESFVKLLKKNGYKPKFDVVYAPNFGVPQNRSRLILLASRIGKINLPDETHKKNEYITVEKTIGELPSIKSGEISAIDPLHQSANLTLINQKRIKQSKPKGSWEDWDKNLLPNCYLKESGKTYKSVYGRMSWDKVSPTITTQFYNYGTGRFGHPVQNRALSLREGALLQTFPKDYDFGNDMSFSTIARHIGNAVPPLLAKHIGFAIIKHVEKIYGKTK